MQSPTQLSARSMLSAMESLNAPLEKAFCAFLNDTIAEPAQHMRFLNMLSMLEHIGSRKIMLSQMKGMLTQDILKHLAEETRHAFFFKREAEKLAKQPIEGYEDAMCAPSGRAYFERLDAGLTRDLLTPPQRETRYLWVSLIVELRAIWVYNFYQHALAQQNHPLSLKGIIAEEDRHLEDMAARLAEIGLDAAARLAEACELEKTLFQKLLAALQTESMARAA